MSLRCLGFLVGLICNLSLEAKQQLQVRGTSVLVPLRLRVKIGDFDVGQTLRISGLTKNSGSPELVCRYRESLSRLGLSLPDLIQVDEGWVCEDRVNGVSLPILSDLSLASAGGLTQVNELQFRGKVQLIRDGSHLILVNQVEMEDYLVGLLNKEMNSKFPQEAIKAQAIAARSYALATFADRKNRTRLYDLLGNEVDQVYQGASYEDPKARKLVEETRGEVLFANNDVLKAYYHAASGGHLEEPGNVWLDRSHPVESQAYVAKPSPFDEKFAPTRWQISLSPSMGEQWPDVGRLKDVRVLERSRGQRVKKLLLVGQRGQKTVGGAEFRRMLGNRWLKSTLFSLRKDGASWTIEGRGFGHGVGMSQLGAKHMAQNGHTAEDILSFYYPNAKLQKIY